MTAAEELRAAAADMREKHGPEHERHYMWECLATWLDDVARQWADDPTHARRAWYDQNRGLALARAYMGATS